MNDVLEIMRKQAAVANQSTFFWREWGSSHAISVKVAGVSSEIWTEHLQNKKQNRHQYAHWFEFNHGTGYTVTHLVVLYNYPPTPFGFVWVLNLVSDIMGRTLTESNWEQRAENIWTAERLNGRRLEKTVELRNLYPSPNIIRVIKSRILCGGGFE
jgi:hypothetical protein